MSWQWGLVAIGTMSFALTACGDDDADSGGDGPTGPLTIMPIGDSITHGESGKHTYRCHLDQMLTDAGVEFDFVGSMSAAFRDAPYGCPWEFDQDHEAVWGAPIESRAYQVMDPFTEMQPDVALVHLGSNNIDRLDIDREADELAQFIEAMQQANPDVTVLVAQLIPCGLDIRACTEGVPQFNERVATFGELSTDDSAVVVVDMNSAVSVDDLYDRIHPNADGDRLMAEQWMAGLRDAGLVGG